MLEVQHSIFLGFDDDDDEVIGLAWDFNFPDRSTFLSIKVTTELEDKTHEKIAEDLAMALSHSAFDGYDDLPAKRVYDFLRTYKRDYIRDVRAGTIRGITRTIKMPEDE